MAKENNATKTCPQCQEEIAANAKKCPKCQSDLRNWFMRHPIISTILGLILLGVIVSALGGTPETSDTGSSTVTQSSNNAANTEPTAAPVAMQITASEIADDFDANQVAAEAEWKNQLVEFSAEVSNITDSGVSFYNVATKEFSLTQISCRVQDKDQLLSIQNGQTITVRGTVEGMSFGVIDMKQCEIVN